MATTNKSTSAGSKVTSSGSEAPAPAQSASAAPGQYRSSGGSSSSSPGTGAISADTIAADAGAVTDEARRLAASVAAGTRDTAASVVNEARSEFDSVVGEVKERVADATDQAKDLANSQKDKIAEQIGGLADAAQRVAEDLEGESAPGASYVRMVADNAQKLSGTIRDSNVDDLLGMAEDFGRKQPAAFLGAAALLGFTASRFLTASAKRRVERQTPAETREDESVTSPAQSTPAGMTGFEGRV